MSKDTPKPNGGIPQTIINQLNEHTAGGFVLFYFNAQSGFPEELMTFDNPAYCLALQKHISDWSSALSDINIENERRFIENSSKEPEKANDDDEDLI